MKKHKTILIVSSLLLSLLMVFCAASIAVLVPPGSRGKNIIFGLMLGLSLLPLVIGFILFKTLTAFAAHSERFATRDPLTNLYNQRTFWDFLGYEIERSIRQQYRFSIMIVDLDNFKAINDLYGHETGDAYLLEFSTIFKAAVRKGDIAARSGGDDFAAILPICDEGQAYIAAKRLLDNLRDHTFHLPNGTTIQITASIGMAVYPDHATNRENLYLVAEAMLLQAKTSGKDRMRLPSDEVNIELLKSAGEKSIFIMDAIRKKQIVPYFQPIVSVKDNSVLAYEVLTRIVTPEKVFPAMDFIDEAEGMGAIGKINYLLIELALEAVKRDDYRGKLFFNLSPKALALNEFMPTLRRLMSAYRLEPSQMVFEITERNTVKNLSLIERTVRELKHEGFQFAIDDFGAGYASFQYIKLFKVDYLKLDGELIRNMVGAGNLEQAIVTNIVSLAGSLGIKTIAEFVESEEIFSNVRLAGIDYAQGYHIRRPLPDLNHASAPVEPAC
jgi:diguanylate cyclase (GGDEF)-like protein